MSNKPIKYSVLDFTTIIMTIKVFLISSVVIPKIEFLDSVLTGLFIVCVCYLVVKKHYRYTVLILIFLVLIVMLYTAYQTRYFDPMITFLYLLALKDKNIDKQINTFFNTNLLMLGIHTIVTIFRFFSGSISLGMFTRGEYRYSLGFIHPNSLGAISFVFISTYLWINYEKLKTKDYAISIIILITVFSLSKSRTPFYLGLLCIFLIILSKNKLHLFDKIIENISQCIFPIITGCIIMIIISYRWGDNVASIINVFLSGRINLGAYAIDRSGFTFWGKYVEFYGHLTNFDYQYEISDFTFDCIYTFMMCSMGIAYIILLSVLFYKVAKKKNKLINIYIILWSLYGLTEVSCLNGFKFFPIFYVAILFSSHDYKYYKGYNKNG